MSVVILCNNTTLDFILFKTCWTGWREHLLSITLSIKTARDLIMMFHKVEGISALLSARIILWVPIEYGLLCLLSILKKVSQVYWLGWRFYLSLYCLLISFLVFFERDPLISAHACKELLLRNVVLLDQNISFSKLDQKFFHQALFFIWQLKEDHYILDEDQIASSLVCQGAEH